MLESLHPAQIEALKRMSVEQKIQAMADLWRAANLMLESQIRRQHPEWDDSAIWSEVRRRLLYGTS